jgi:cystathionine beta-lyase/cystathionine gamma-synthase
VNRQPPALGADLLVHSANEYPCENSDPIAGALIANLQQARG